MQPAVTVLVAGGPVGSPFLQVLVVGVAQKMSQTNFWAVVTVAVVLHDVLVADGRQVVQGHSFSTVTVQPLVMVAGGRVLAWPLVHVVVATGQFGHANTPVGVAVTVLVLAQCAFGTARALYQRSATLMMRC